MCTWPPPCVKKITRNAVGSCVVCPVTVIRKPTHIGVLSHSTWAAATLCGNHGRCLFWPTSCKIRGVHMAMAAITSRKCCLKWSAGGGISLAQNSPPFSLETDPSHSIENSLAWLSCWLNEQPQLSWALSEELTTVSKWSEASAGFYWTGS